MSDVPPAQIWLSPRETSKRLGLSERALERWRHRGVGPQWARFGGRVIRYRLDLVDAWATQQLTDAQAEP